MTVPFTEAEAVEAGGATKRPDLLKAELATTQPAEESGTSHYVSSFSKDLEEGTDVENGGATSMTVESLLQYFKKQFKEHTCKKLLTVAIGLALFVGGCTSASRWMDSGEWWVPLVLCGMGLIFGSAPCQKGVNWNAQPRHNRHYGHHHNYNNHGWIEGGDEGGDCGGGEADCGDDGGGECDCGDGGGE